MNIDPTKLDPNIINQILNSIPYPIGKSHVIQFARDRGASEQIMALLDKLPDVTFNSADEVKSKMAIFGNLGDHASKLGENISNNIGNIFNKG
ncbi:MAG TPA: DUF2795 domain-containing protein [Ktedonosporobacter sp.]|nr:DUF2795 domain-containing protein [Ktedonosporobacter sp.]